MCRIRVALLRFLAKIQTQLHLFSNANGEKWTIRKMVPEATAVMAMAADGACKKKTEKWREIERERDEKHKIYLPQNPHQHVVYLNFDHSRCSNNPAYRNHCYRIDRHYHRWYCNRWLCWWQWQQWWWRKLRWSYHCYWCRYSYSIHRWHDKIQNKRIKSCVIIVK